MKENEQIEFKKSTSELKESLKSIVAILNKHQSGKLYFGITPSGKSIKNTISEKSLRDISQAISNKIEPRIFPKILVYEIEKIEVIKVEFEGFQTPYSADGRYFIRVADEDKQMTNEQLKSFVINNNDLRWDTITNPKFIIDNIDLQKTEQFSKRANINYNNLEDLLENNNLIKDSKLSNASIALFGKEPVTYFRNLKLLCSIFATTNTSTIIDQKEFAGDLFYLIEKAEKYILQNIHFGMEIEGLYRKDIPEINSEAIRETVINAFLHRDYFDPDFVTIGIFKDRIEIKNPGKLLNGLTINDILERNISRRRNEIIADIFSRVNFIERKGRGIALIKEKEPNTKFEQIGNFFVSTFVREISIPDKMEKLVVTLGENQQRIIELISTNSKIKISELAKKIGVSSTTVDKHIKKLKSIGVLKREGTKKDSNWIIRDEFHKQE